MTCDFFEVEESSLGDETCLFEDLGIEYTRTQGLIITGISCNCPKCSPQC